MEFVVVMPLYCALLGGMFFVGELMVNRIRLQVGDQVGTVLAASRLRRQIPGDDGDPIREVMESHVFHDTMELAGEISVGRDPKNLNGFMSMWAGGIRRLEVSAPNWMRGMLYMHQAFGGGDMEDLTTKRVYNYLPDADFRRSVSFHRNAAWSENLDRAASAGDVVCRGILGEVLSDTWILSDSTSETGDAVAPRISSEVYCVKRCLSQWGE